jgi:hypothetical protein
MGCNVGMGCNAGLNGLGSGTNRSAAHPGGPAARLARQWPGRPCGATRATAPQRRHRHAATARAREARSYVRGLLAERGWTEDIEREAGHLVAAALAADRL